MARKKLHLTDQEIKRIETMAGVGINVSQMAAVLGMSKKTFERRMKDTPGSSDALEKGRSLAALNVTQTAYSLAVGGKVPAMTMFWLKCRERWKETSVQEHSGLDGKPIETLNKSDMTDDQLEAKLQAMLVKTKVSDDP